MTIDILLTVYNGERYVEEQVRSLQAQTHADWRLWVRDDGSTDGTVPRIRSLAGADDRVRLVQDPRGRVGACAGFAWLLEQVPEDAPYLMFCDADDVWLPNKIEVTLNAMRRAEREIGEDNPVLVHTDLTVVDAHLRVIEQSYWRYQAVRPEHTDLKRMLIQNRVTGCTVMINRSLRRLGSPIPAEAFMHDWWLALVASCFGRIEHVTAPTILYRQHGSNDTGARRHQPGLIGFVRRAWNAPSKTAIVRNGLFRTAVQARAFLERYRDRLDPSSRRLLSRYADIAACGSLRRKLRLLELGTLPDVLERDIGLILRA